MRKNFGPSPLMYPTPILVIASYDENGNANALVGGGSFIGYTQVALILSKNHKTVQNILKTNAFTVSMMVADHVVACDYLGMVSGNNVPDKLEKVGFHITKSEFVNAPLFEELPVALECEFVSYDEKTGLLIGNVINASADQSVLDENGKIDVDKLRPVAIETMYNTYRVLGEQVGKAYSDGLKLK